MKSERVSDYKDKIFKHKMGLLYRTLLIIVLIVLAFAGVKYYLDHQVYNTFETMQTMKRVGTSESVYLNYDGRLLTYSKDGISAYDAKGNQLWNQTYEMQSPIVKQQGQYVIVCDYKGSIYYLMDQNGPISSVDTHMPILSLDVSKGGVVAVSVQDNETVFLKLFTKEGELIADTKTTMRQSGYPISFALSPDNIKFGVSYLKAEGGKMNSTLAFYNFGGVGKNEMDNLVSGFDYQTKIFPLLIYPNENYAISASDNLISIFEGKQKPNKKKEIELENEIKGFYYNESYFGVVFQDMDQEGKIRIQIYDMNGKEVLNQVLDFQYKDIYIDADRLIVYNEARLLIISMSGIVKFDGELNGEVKAVIPIDDRNEFLVVYDNDMQLIKLR